MNRVQRAILCWSIIVAGQAYSLGMYAWMAGVDVEDKQDFTSLIVVCSLCLALAIYTLLGYIRKLKRRD